MIKYDINNTYYISDTHFNHSWVNKSGEHRSVCLFERTQFETIQEHDDFIVLSLRRWAAKHVGATLIHLGDFGDIDYLWVFRELKNLYFIHTVFVYGNHDKLDDLPKFEDTFCEVYLYPTYIHPRIVVSHEPVWPVAAGCVNVHGHLHGAKLDSPAHINASIHVAQYHTINPKSVLSALGKVGKPSFKFLQEPYREEYIFTQPKPDVVYDRKTKKINLKESLKKFNSIHGKNLV